MADKVVEGVIDSLRKRETLHEPTCLQIGALDGPGGDCEWTDGLETVPGKLPTELKQRLIKEGVQNGGVLRITEYVCNKDPQRGSYSLAVFDYEMVSKTAPPGDKHLAVKSEPVESGANAAKAAIGAEPPAAETPRAKENAGPFKTPAAKTRVSRLGTPGPTPPSTGRKSAQPIQYLNPYNNQWTIKARVTNKTPMRTAKKDSNNPFHTFTVNIVDEQGTEIEGTFWREAADRFFDRLEEGKVYFFTKGKVKPANKTYSTARNDYSIDFQIDTQIEEAIDADPDKMKAKLCYSRLNQLGSFLGRRMLVDIIAIVKDIGALGSVKRKTDGTELQRRDLTLVDQTKKMVKLTIWGALAENAGAELEALKDSNPVVSITSVRVNDYEGISLSSVSRSNLLINPESEEAMELRAWWDGEGASAAFTHVAEGLPTANRENISSELVTLNSVVIEDIASLPPPDAKPKYSNVKVMVMRIDPDQKPFFYPADPASGKKVVEDGSGGWRLAAEDKAVAGMTWRYFVKVTVVDHTGSAEIFLSNDQGEKLLGVKGDDMHGIRESNSLRFETILHEQQFSGWTLLIKSNTSEFKGNLRQRLQGTGKMEPLDFAAESKRLLEKIPRKMQT